MKKLIGTALMWLVAIVLLYLLINYLLWSAAFAFALLKPPMIALGCVVLLIFGAYLRWGK